MEKIRHLHVHTSQVAIFYLGQAGFCIKTSDGQITVIDAYCSDACERLFGFKRMTPTVLGIEDLDADLFLSTHSHTDHLDPDALPVIAKNIHTFFVGSPDCEALYIQNNIPKSRYQILKKGEKWLRNGIGIRAIEADHGSLAPDAIGLLIETGELNIYHTGDTCFAPDKIKTSLNTDVDIMIAPINGQFGNMNASEACALASVVKPKIIIACHFWMFLEHVCEGGKGDPSTFLKEASEILPESVSAIVMAPGEVFTYTKEKKK
jgi:L-ascorbate 6-phosphate lactonase